MIAAASPGSHLLCPSPQSPPDQSSTPSFLGHPLPKAHMRSRGPPSPDWRRPNSRNIGPHHWRRGPSVTRKEMRGSLRHDSRLGCMGGRGKVQRSRTMPIRQVCCCGRHYRARSQDILCARLNERCRGARCGLPGQQIFGAH